MGRLVTYFNVRRPFYPFFIPPDSFSLSLNNLSLNISLSLYSCLGTFPLNKYNPPNKRTTNASFPVNSLGRIANPPASNKASLAVSKFISFTLFKKALARSSSSILRIPVPSTSQRPPWATFHKPFSADFLYPSAKKRGKTMSNLVQ